MTDLASVARGGYFRTPTTGREAHPSPSRPAPSHPVTEPGSVSSPSSPGPGSPSRYMDRLYALRAEVHAAETAELLAAAGVAPEAIERACARVREIATEGWTEGELAEAYGR